MAVGGACIRLSKPRPSSTINAGSNTRTGRPGEGHDKGGVEARGKNVRLQHLTPVPCGASLAQIAGRLVEDLDAAAAARRIRQGGTVAERFREEQAALRALPERSFEAAKWSW